MEGEKKIRRGRPRKYDTEAARREALLARNRRHNRKLASSCERVVAFLDAEDARKMADIMKREGLASKAAAVRWMIDRCAALPLAK